MAQIDWSAIPDDKPKTPPAHVSGGGIDWSAIPDDTATPKSSTVSTDNQSDTTSFLTRSVLKTREGSGPSEWIRKALDEVEKSIGPIQNYGKTSQFMIRTGEALARKGVDISDFATSPLGIGMMAMHVIPYTRWIAGIADTTFAVQQGLATAQSVGKAIKDQDLDSAAEAVADAAAASFAFLSGKETLKHAEIPKLGSITSPQMQEFARKLAGVSTEQKQSSAVQGLLRNRMAEAITDNMRMTSILMEARDHVDTLTDAQRMEAIHRIETSATGRRGVRQVDAKTQQASDLITHALDNKWDDILSLKIPGVDQHFYENYFPRFYKEFEGAQKAIQGSYARRPFTGQQGFRYKRSILGPIRNIVDPAVNPNPQLHLVTTNFIDLGLMKLHELRKFEMALKVVRESKSEGLIERVLPGDSPTPGWKKINDHIIPKSEIPQGGYIYAPAEVAKNFNNFLGPGLGQWLGEHVPGSILGGATAKGLEAIKGFNNASARFLVSWSAFHAFLSYSVAAANEAAIGVEQAFRGVSAAVHGDLGAATNRFLDSGKSFTRSLGWAPIDYYMKGGKLMAHAMDPSLYPQFSPMLDALQKGGGRPGIDTYYRSRQTDQYFRNWIAENRRQGKSVFFPKAIAKSMNWIMEDMVPRLKLGSAMRMFENEMDKWGPNWHQSVSVEKQREVFGQIVDSIDNRHGQLIYDNVFWPRMLKDVGFASMQFMGFTMGTVREAAGGVTDLLRIPLKLLLHEKVEVPRRAAWTFMAMPFIAGISNAIAQYYMTGTKPGDDPDGRKIAGVIPVDYIYPWNGKYLPSGEKERITLPSSAYLRTLTNPLEQGLASTVKGKLSNTLQILWGEMAENADFQNRQLWNKEDPAIKNIAQELAFTLERLEPIPLQRTILDTEAGETTPLSSLGQSFAGISNAPVTAMRSNAENLLAQYSKAAASQGPLSEDEYDKKQGSMAIANQLAHKSIGAPQVMAAAADGRISKNDARKILRQAAIDPWDRRGYWGRQFIKLEPARAVSVWRASTPRERKKLVPLMEYEKTKISKNSNAQYRVKWVEEISKLLVEYQDELSNSATPPVR